MNAIPIKMRGIYLLGHGDLEQLEFRDDIPTPSPGLSDVLIRVSAAGVNNTDLNTRKAWYSKGTKNLEDASWAGEAIRFPRIQGIDVCGTIVKVGKRVDKAMLNQRVIVEPCLREVNGKWLNTPWFLGSECDGGFAKYVVVASRHAYPIQSSFSDVELASFPCSYSTAENLLTRAKVDENDVVCVTGASGGVGSAAVQLAKARHAKVIAIANPSKSNKLKSLGADQVLSRNDHLLQKLGENQIDVVIDLVAGEKWGDLLNILKPFGRYAVAGAIGGAHVNLDVRTLYLKDLNLMGCTVLEPSVFKNLIQRIEAEEIVPVVAKTFPLHQIAAAQKYFEAKQYTGKIVLTID
ncbi:MAG: alcohol dehydrogenase family protein [SAR324 cluster bacterium]|nr:alcohol dehydrogenase family protein [SAR324 cluster bacterium]